MSGPLKWLMQQAEGTKRRLKDLTRDPLGRLSADAENILADYREDPLSLVGPHIPGGPAMAGMLRRNGAPGINAWTEIPERNIFRALELGTGELTSPSVYVAKGGPRFTFGDVALVARPDALDPIRRPGRLYNRDAWTPLKNSFEPNSVASNRLRNKFEHGGHTDYRGSTGLNNIGHRLMVEQSPSFSSFREYENSPHGAKLLTGSTRESGLPKGVADEIQREIRRETMLHNARRLHLDVPDDESLKRFMTMTDGHVDEAKYPGFYQLNQDYMRLKQGQRYRQFLETVKEGNPYSRELLGRARSAPSNYAELKVSGPLAINRDNFIAAIPQHSDTIDPMVVEMLRRRGIPTIDRTGLAAERDLVDLMNMITEESAYPLEHLMVKPWIDELGPLD